MSKITEEEYKKALLITSAYNNQCSKCGMQFSDRWEHASNSFIIQFNVDCCSTDAIWGEEDKAVIGFKHPAMSKDSGYQGITLKGGIRENYKICPFCNRKLMRVVGDFLKSSA